jgi:hypothetical protein
MSYTGALRWAKLMVFIIIGLIVIQFMLKIIQVYRMRARDIIYVPQRAIAYESRVPSALKGQRREYGTLPGDVAFSLGMLQRLAGR